MINISRLLVFKRGAGAKLPVIQTEEQVLSAHDLVMATPGQLAEGRELYNLYCAVCHGGNAVSGGLVPDLRHRIADLDASWQAIVFDGALASGGMPAWKDYLSGEEVDTIKAYVAHEARLGSERGAGKLPTHIDIWRFK
jgi:quinohemoprotein ethanol dehydrogenase